ncbi:hypothetical protein DEH69_16100 [Streptomyces sp. PT12]|nr:hypothetical protein DEH69_16100 [Streptomyces sp. PT12]
MGDLDHDVAAVVSPDRDQSAFFVSVTPGARRPAISSWPSSKYAGAASPAVRSESRSASGEGEGDAAGLACRDGSGPGGGRGGVVVRSREARAEADGQAGDAHRRVRQQQRGAAHDGAGGRVGWAMGALPLRWWRVWGCGKSSRKEPGWASESLRL